jgi:hypothetical protein
MRPDGELAEQGRGLHRQEVTTVQPLVEIGLGGDGLDVQVRGREREREGAQREL